MTFDIVTIFPAMIRHALAEGVVGRAIERGTLDVAIHDLRDFTTDRHRVVDDMPYGGGPGMVLKPEPIFRALDAIGERRGAPPETMLTALMSPQGTRFTQAEAVRLSGAAHVVLLCGRYEGVDERVRARVAEDISLGDSVLSGGELPALVVVDAVARHVPGVGGSLRVPDVLLSATHAEIRRWRKRESLSRTLERRPERLAGAALDEEEQEILRELVAGRKT